MNYTFSIKPCAEPITIVGNIQSFKIIAEYMRGFLSSEASDFSFFIDDTKYPKFHIQSGFGLTIISEIKGTGIVMKGDKRYFELFLMFFEHFGNYDEPIGPESRGCIDPKVHSDYIKDTSIRIGFQLV